MSDKWHDDHKKAIAEKWVQCPPVTTKVKELIGDEVCMGTYGLVELEVMQLETELAEARAENNVLKAALWHYGNRMGPNIAEELKDGLPERLWRKINLKEVEETDGEEV